MRAFLLPLGLTIVSNVVYHLAQKSVPRNADPMLSLVVTYIVALVVTLVFLLMGGLPKEASFRTLNWATVATGVAIVGVEIGFLLAYRAGLHVSLGAVTSNVAVALVMLPLGVMLFREHLSPANLAGLVLCLGGLALIVR